MRLDDERQSEHVEDRRDDGATGGGPFGGGFSMGRGGGGPGMGLPIPMGRVGIGAISVVAVRMPSSKGRGLGSMRGGGGDPNLVPQQRPQSMPPSGQAASRQGQPPGTAQMKRFVGAVLASTEDVWREQLPAQPRVN